jgi:hypothetical protein
MLRKVDTIMNKLKQMKKQGSENGSSRSQKFRSRALCRELDIEKQIQAKTSNSL